ncbi:hypothetical protein SAMN05216344_106136 [Polaromonas sp. OV174]|uniref:hypothetical protein n=1 Tax=Polaromonas sp. OV174 TaxID=1855300 RepID=UPI0008F411F7|nr:hypothetical protein [Polaromonas sp. OV174]SFB96950.1 hypothetical protein SAMN05216344_106136 [Polaromonas sp. OV174]
MPEPTSTTGAAGAALVAISSSLVGAKYGAIATVAFAAFVGTLISLGEVATTGRLDALKYVGRYVLMAVVIAGTLSALVEIYWSIPAMEVLALVAFLIGWIGSRWQGVLGAALSGLSALAGRKGAGP